MDELSPFTVFLIFAAPIVIFVGWLMAYGVRERRHAADRALKTPRLRAEEIARLHPPPERVAVEVHIATDPARTVRSRLTGTDCVWYTVRVWHIVARGDNDGDHEIELHRESGGADPIPVTDRTGPLNLEVKLAESALLPATKSLAETTVDEDTLRTREDRTAPLAPHLAELLQSGALSEDQLHPTSTTKRFRVVELVLRPGRRALVIGRPRIVDDTVLLEPVDGGGVTVLTDDEITAYVARTNSSVTARLATPLLILGAGLILLACWRIGLGSG